MGRLDAEENNKGKESTTSASSTNGGRTERTLRRVQPHALRWHASENDGLMGASTWRADRKHEGPRSVGPSIWISPVWALGQDRQWVRPILLHEMAHVEVGQSGGEPDLREHGALWRAAMMRLYAQGEDWVSENLRKAADKERDEDRLLAPMFTEMTRLPPTLSWDAVCEHLLKKFGTRHTRKWGLSARDLIERSPRLLAFLIDHVRERVVADP
jgi:hypothetical protein